MHPVSPADVDRFYRAATVGLAVLDARPGGGRRFGVDADARWRAFRGALRDWDRLELVVRDAAVASPAGFAPRSVFDLPALADDEPCGPDWTGPTPTEATDLLAAVLSLPRDAAPALARVAEIWGLEPRPPRADATGDIEPSTHLLIAGAGAVLALSAAFTGRPELDLADQAVLVANDPATRQLFGLAVAFLGSRRPVRLFRIDTTTQVATGPAVSGFDRVLVSEEVPPDLAKAIRTIGHAKGARDA